MSKLFLNASPDDLKSEWKRMMPEQGQNAEQMYDGCRIAALGQTRKSVTATRMSAVGGRAEVDFGRLHVSL